MSTRLAAACALAIGATAIAIAQQSDDGYTLRFHTNYAMVMGPPGVTWCSRLSTLNALVAQYSASPLGYSPLASLTQQNSTDPLFEILLPYATSGELPFILMMDQDGKVYYAAAASQPDGSTVVYVQAYISPGEFARLVADPATCLAVTRQDVPDAARLFSGLASSPYLGPLVRARTPELFAEVEQLYQALSGPANPNEPWAGPKPDLETFTQRLLDLLNATIGDEANSLSLYGRRLYSAKQLPVQIIEIMRQINELGGAYNSESDPNERDDPWKALRPQPQDGGQTPSDPKRLATINEKVRLLNRLLLEAELSGCLQGTMYHSVKVISGYGPCLADVASERFTDTPPTFHQPRIAPIMPITLDAAGKPQLLLDRQPRSAPLSDSIPDLPFFTVGPGGQLAGPLPQVPDTQVFAVQGRDLHWVDVEREGHSPGR